MKSLDGFILFGYHVGSMAKGRKLPPEEIEQRTRTRRERGWNRDPESTAEKHRKAKEGFRHSAESIAKMKEIQSKRDWEPRLEKKHSEETRKKLSEFWKQKWKDPEYRERVVRAHKKNWEDPEFRERMTDSIVHLYHQSPTEYEQQIIELCEKYELPFKFVGDGTVVFDGKSPDFIATNGHKLLIETSCDYFKKINKHYVDEADYELKRSKFFEELGYRVLFLNDSHLHRPDWEEVCLREIKSFLESWPILLL